MWHSSWDYKLNDVPMYMDGSVSLESDAFISEYSNIHPCFIFNRLLCVISFFSLSIIVIVVEVELVSQVQILDKAVYIPPCINALGKGMNLPPALSN